MALLLGVTIKALSIVTSFISVMKDMGESATIKFSFLCVSVPLWQIQPVDFGSVNLWIFQEISAITYPYFEKLTGTPLDWRCSPVAIESSTEAKY